MYTKFNEYNIRRDMYILITVLQKHWVGEVRPGGRGGGVTERLLTSEIVFPLCIRIYLVLILGNGVHLAVVHVFKRPRSPHAVTTI